MIMVILMIIDKSFLEGINFFLIYLVQVINKDTLRETPI